MNNRNICNTCAPHTAGEACLAPTIAPKARTLNSYAPCQSNKRSAKERQNSGTRIFYELFFLQNLIMRYPWHSVGHLTLQKQLRELTQTKNSTFVILFY